LAVRKELFIAETSFDVSLESEYQISDTPIVMGSKVKIIFFSFLFKQLGQ